MVPRRGPNKLNFNRVINKRTIISVVLTYIQAFQLAVILLLSEHIMRIREVVPQVRRTYLNGRERHGRRLRRLPRVIHKRMIILVRWSESTVIT